MHGGMFPVVNIFWLSSILFVRCDLLKKKPKYAILMEQRVSYALLLDFLNTAAYREINLLQ